MSNDSKVCRCAVQLIKHNRLADASKANNLVEDGPEVPAVAHGHGVPCQNNLLTNASRLYKFVFGFNPSRRFLCQCAEFKVSLHLFWPCFFSVFSPIPGSNALQAGLCGGSAVAAGAGRRCFGHLGQPGPWRTQDLALEGLRAHYLGFQFRT